MPTNSTPPLWWRDQNKVDDLFHGVFKGGGAKGVAYSGALKATLSRKIWFNAVAGSSAGAITATLIAAGLTPDEIQNQTPFLLQGVRHNRLGLLLAGASPLYSSKGLIEGLRSILDTQVKSLGTPSTDRVVSFQTLFETTQIQLFVVVMDLATSHPVVLSHFTTPACEVALAVAASSAIPLGFSSGRLIMLEENSQFSVHRVVDGGAWANYPQFVFRDASFRKYYGLPQLAPKEKILGFVLERGRTNRAQVPWNFRQDLEADDLADSGLFVESKVARFVLRRLDKTRWRLLTMAFWPFLMCVLTGGWILGNESNLEPLRASIAGWIPFGRVLLAASFAVSALLLLGLALTFYFLGRELIRVGFGSLLAALSVTTDVPPWVGSTPEDPVIRVPVPPRLGTRTFRISADRLAQIVDNAYVATIPQVEAVLSGRATTQVPHLPSNTRPPKEEEIQSRTYFFRSRTGLCFSLLWIGFGITALGNGRNAQIVNDTAINGGLVGGGPLILLIGAFCVASYLKGRALKGSEPNRRIGKSTFEENEAQPVNNKRSSSSSRSRVIWRAILAFSACLVVGTMLVTEVSTLRENDTGAGTVVERRNLSSKTFLYTVNVDTKDEGLRNYRFSSNIREAPGKRVSLRWISDERRMEFSPEVWGRIMTRVGLGGAVVAMLVLGTIWAASDRRSLVPTTSSRYEAP